MNASLCIELYLSFKNPFYPGERRLKWYILFSIICLVAIGNHRKSWLVDRIDYFYDYKFPEIFNGTL
jgi:hypothetical protein